MRNLKSLYFLLILFAIHLGSQAVLADKLQTLTNESILQLVAWHVNDREIIAVIGLETNRCSFDMSPNAVTNLKTKGVSSEIVEAMQRCPTAVPKAGSAVPSSVTAKIPQDRPQVGAVTDAALDRIAGTVASPPSDKSGTTGPVSPQDQIVLLSGSAIKGQVLYVQCATGQSKPLPASIQFQMTDLSSKAGISIQKVQSLMLSDNAVRLSPGGTALPSDAIRDYLSASPSKRVGLSSSTSEQSLAKAMIDACNATDHYWNGDITITGAYGIGTQTQKQIGGGLATSYIRKPQVYGWDYQIAKIDLEAKYTVAAKVGSPALKTQEIYYGDFTYSFFPSAHWSPWGVARLYHNYSLGLGLGQIYGGGVAYNIRGLVLSGGIVGITERLYAPSVPFSSAGARLYESYATVLGATKITFFESVDVFPSFQSAKAIQGRGVTGFVIPAWSRLQFIPKFGDDYLGNAPPKHRLNYSNTSVSLDIKVGRTQ